MIAVISLALQIGDVVHHWEDTEATAEEIVEALKTDGNLVYKNETEAD